MGLVLFSFVEGTEEKEESKKEEDKRRKETNKASEHKEREKSERFWEGTSLCFCFYYLNVYNWVGYIKLIYSLKLI